MDPRPTDTHLATGRKLLALEFPVEPGRWLLASISRQMLWLLADGAAGPGLKISSAKAGIDAREGSGGTPPGLHVISDKIGTDEPAGTEFVSRRPTGRIWIPADEPVEDDLILSRILVLDGLQPGINRGPGVDSRARYIYIHGTNHEDQLGRPLSHGCLRLGNDDMIQLFDQVSKGDPLAII